MTRLFRQRSLRTALTWASALLLGCALVTYASAQAAPGKTPPPPRPTAPSPAAISAVPHVPDSEDLRRFKGSEIAGRPYSAALPGPLYPATPRVQKQFTVQYIFNYAESTYTPAVALPLVPRTAARRDTPEAALAAFYSAMRNGDYEAWLECWDEPSRKALQEITRKDPKGAESWRAAWRQSFPGRRFLLVDRVETVNFIILDARIEDPAKPGAPQLDQEILVGHKGEWLVSNAFSNDGFVMNHEPGSSKVVKEYELRPSADLAGPAALTGQAQQEFLNKHTRTQSITRTLE